MTREEEAAKAKVLAQRMEAADEALKEFVKASKERRRAVFIAHGDGTKVDVTEDVVSIMDQLTMTLDWGSGFFDDDQLRSFFKLADLLKIDVSDKVQRPS